MKTRMFMLVLLAAALPASIAAQTTSHASWRVDEARMRVQAADTFKETAVALHFEADGIEIRSVNTTSDGEAEVKQVPYAEIDSAEFSPYGTALPRLSALGNRQLRRLTIRCGDDITVVQVHKRYEKRVRQELARRGGVAVTKSPYMSRGSFHWPAAI